MVLTSLVSVIIHHLPSEQSSIRTKGDIHWLPNVLNVPGG